MIVKINITYDINRRKTIVNWVKEMNTKTSNRVKEEWRYKLKINGYCRVYECKYKKMRSFLFDTNFTGKLTAPYNSLKKHSEVYCREFKILKLI